MQNKTDHPMALPPLETSLTAINREIISKAITASRESPRGRIIQPFHKEGNASLQRMLNALQPGSYIRPHRHASDRGESIVVLQGSILFVTFSETGEASDSLCLKAGSKCIGVDVEGGIYHSFMVLEPDTVLFEVKPGPYDVETDKSFAPWAPEECSTEAAAYLKQLLALCSE